MLIALAVLLTLNLAATIWCAVALVRLNAALWELVDDDIS